MVDVAAAAGVSKATVSRVLQQRGRFSPESRLKVLVAVRELGFVPNVMASELASKQSTAVGLLLRDASNPAYAALFVELARAARDADVPLISMTVHHDRRGGFQVQALQRLIGMRVAGLIVATGDVTSDQLSAFRDSVPILRAGRPEAAAYINAVSYDELDNSRLITEHVLHAGHERIAVIQPTEHGSLPEHVRAQTMIELIRAGGRTVHVIRADEADDGVQAALALVVDAGVTAIMTPTDKRQMTVMRGALRLGLTVPGLVSVTGMDGLTPGSDLLGLTTVRLPVEELATRAMARMTQLIRGEHPALRHERLQGVLVPGTTLASPRARE